MIYVNDIEKFVQRVLEVTAENDFHFMKEIRTYHCQTPEHVETTIGDALDSRCIGCVIGTRMETGSTDRPLKVDEIILYGDDRITALDQLIELATQPTDLSRIVEPVQ